MHRILRKHRWLALLLLTCTAYPRLQAQEASGAAALVEEQLELVDRLTDETLPISTEPGDDIGGGELLEKLVGGSPDNNGGDPSTNDVPVDGGIGFMLASGLAYGVHRHRARGRRDSRSL